MADSVTDYPYETRLNILYPPLELIDEKALSDACEFKWFNQTLCKVNESVVRVAIIEGEYHSHRGLTCPQSIRLCDRNIESRRQDGIDLRCVLPAEAGL